MVKKICNKKKNTIFGRSPVPSFRTSRVFHFHKLLMHNDPSPKRIILTLNQVKLPDAPELSLSVDEIDDDL
jgi:hypothetical protein